MKGMGTKKLTILLLVVVVVFALGVYVYVNNIYLQLERLRPVGEESGLRFSIAGYYSNGKDIIIQNNGFEPIQTSNIDIVINDYEAEIITPELIIQPGELGILKFETNQTEYARVEVSEAGGYQVVYYTYIGPD